MSQQFRYYWLIWHIPIGTNNPLEAEQLFSQDGSKTRVVGRTRLRGNVIVSTVFLSINHQWRDGPPILFQTMVFGGKLDGLQYRCSTWKQAALLHRITRLEVLRTLPVSRQKHATGVHKAHKGDTL
jgi:hypothetical protein